MAANPFEDFSYREQRAQMRLSLPKHPEVRRFPIHPVYGELEHPFVCQGPCGMTVLVGPSWRHIKPSEFVCGECLTASGELEPVEFEALHTDAGRDGTLTDGLAGQPERDSG